MRQNKWIALLCVAMLSCALLPASAYDYALPEETKVDYQMPHELGTSADSFEMTADDQDVADYIQTWVQSHAEEDAAAIQSDAPALNLSAKSVVLLEASTGKVLYEQNKDERLHPASITKIMTLILIMEEIDAGRLKLDDVVSVSETAAGMGGSQIYMEAGETLSVDDMLKSIAVVSANDACVAMAEHIAGSAEEFVSRMNEKAAALGMENTHFMNCHGLDDLEHLTTAYDIALMSQELLKHELVLKYSNIWMDHVRDGQFQLANTNKLLKTYSGINGLKTGSTSQAGFCLSATAQRDGMELIGVVLGAENSKIRFAEASRLLDYGFGAFRRVTIEQTGELAPIDVLKGKKGESAVQAREAKMELIIGKNTAGEGTVQLEIAENVTAPAEVGQKVGILAFYLDSEKVGESDIVIAEEVLRESYFGYFCRLSQDFFLCSQKT